MIRVTEQCLTPKVFVLLSILKRLDKPTRLLTEEIAEVLIRFLPQGEIKRLIKFLEELQEKKYGKENNFS